MKSTTFKLDRQVYELLKDARFQQFTIRSLRDSYASRAAVVTERAHIWRYVYDQTRRLQRVGWVRQDHVKRRRDQLFHVLEMPQALALVLLDPPAEANAISLPCEAISKNSLQLERVNTSVGRLESLVKEVRLDMLTAMGEAERYKQLITEMPVLRRQIEQDYIDARDRSSRLLGHLRAIEKTLRSLVSK